jgi:predicted dehydrogenase
VDPRRLEDLLVTGSLVITDKVADDSEVLASANVGFTDYPAVTFRRATGIGALLLDVSPASWSHRETLRFVRHVALAVAGAADPPDLAVGMIGYGAIGHEHAVAVTAVPGMRLAAVSDPDPARLEVARTVADDVLAFDDSDALLAEAGVDLVVVSTPPSTHADWARRALEAGTHVVLEKPMALTAADCDEVMALAEATGLLVVVYQNRRYDPDYLVMRRLVAAGAVGELFHVESFVGGYSHPCNYWHSDADVSGGAIFDWGSHYIDQLLDLMPGEVAHVTAANHKRVWHDVTNADHSRVTIHFADGRQADFIHSDLAAAPKPKWWALGTRGAIRGDWRSERVVGRSAVGTLEEDVLAPADSPAAMSLHAPDGSVTALAVPPPPSFAFHRELADHLLRGLPMSVDAAQSRRVVAVMEAAERSAATGSAPVRLA